MDDISPRRSTEFPPERAAAIRAALITEVAERMPQPRRRALWATALVAGGVMLGVGGTAGAFAASGALSSPDPAMPTADGRADPDYPDPVPAPPGTIPGSPIVSALGEPFSAAIAGSTEVPLDPPDGATELRVTITPSEPGSLGWGLDAGGNNPRVSVSARDIEGGTATTWYDFPVDGSERTFYLDAGNGYEGTATFQWTLQIPTELGVNARGETFGVAAPVVGTPDLILVVAETPDGGWTEGYARSADLNASSPDHPGLPSSPAEALEWQREAQEKYPDGWQIPVFESDGVTQVGVFTIGG